MYLSFELKDGKSIRSFQSESIGPYPHWHEHCELVFVEKGNIMYYIEDEANPIYLETGALLWLKPNVMHTPTQVGSSAYQIHVISFMEYDVFPLCGDIEYLRRIAPACKAQLPEELMIGVGQMMKYFNSTEGEDTVDTLLLRQYTAFLLGLMKKFWAHIPESKAVKQIDEKYLRIRSACKYIEEHPEENPNPEELAKIANYSLSHFYRLFTGVVGCSVHEYMIRVKIREAQRLLKCGEGNVTEVSYRLGFSHPNNFSRTYRKLMGVNPSEDIRKRTE